ncbi:hypothetical protein [Yersinia rochesterensis]|uniref:hypothetical protein n=1 Tax=Yersinia rochesterensis TaxID=1604335 RepID=UPI0011A0D7B1|nr:hypothetical protein [Yersinia rochesterensis]
MMIVSNVMSNTQVVITNDDQKDKSDSNDITLEKIKLEIVTAFTGIEYDAKSKISNLIKRNTNVTTLEDVIISVNKYLEKSKDTDRCNLFISNIEKDQNSELNKSYKLEKHSNGVYQFIDRKDIVKFELSSELNVINQQKEKKIKERVNSEKNNEMKRAELRLKEEVKVKKEEIECIKNELRELFSRCGIFRGLVDVHSRVFECKVFSGSDRIIKEYSALKNKMPDSSDLIMLKEHFDKLDELKRSYNADVVLNMNSLSNFHEDLESFKSEEIPDTAQMISTMLEKISNQEKTIWTKFMDSIAYFLFPNLFESRESDKMKSVTNLVNLKGLVTDLYEKPDYKNVLKAKWLYGLVTQMLIKGTPTQYPFDPLNVLSPDRKVWLELQKGWLKPLESKSDEPKLSS